MIDEKQSESIVQQHSNEGQKSYKKIKDYLFSHEWKLGAGSFSEVFRGVDTRNNSSVAVKVIKLQSITSKIALTLLDQQIKVIKQLDHQNVIKCFDVLNSPNNCYIITDFCKYGDLDKLLKIKKKFEEYEIGTYVYQIFNGLKYLASKTIIHRDFKSANILIDQSNTCKITDFGFAIKSADQFKDICLGSPLYMAPEAILNKEYGPKTDLWAFGVLIYELICGKPPLSGVKSQEQIRQKIVLPPPLIKQPISNQLRNFIDRCLTIPIKNRMSIIQMENHDYMRRIIQQNQNRLSSSMSLSQKSGERSNEGNTKVTSKSSRLIYRAIMENPLTYQEGVCLLQYCRLLSKVCQILKSPILQHWLLRMIRDLNKTKLRQNQVIDYNKYKETISNYYSRYTKQFKDKGLTVRIDDALKECEDLLARDKKHQPQIMAIGTQTNLLRQALFHPLKLVYYTKTSNASKYMS